VNVKREVERFASEFERIGLPARAEGEKKYLKSNLHFYGVGVPALRKAIKLYKHEHQALERTDLLALVDGLWETNGHELRSVGIGLLEVYSRLLRAGDMAVVECILRRSNTWAYVDWISVMVAGSLVDRFSTAKKVLSRWSKDENFWVRRASMLALLRPLKAGSDDFDLFARFAGGMIEEKEFFIRKAIGWILREVSKSRPESTYGFLSEHIDRVAGLTLREGAKYLPASERDELMQAYAARPRRAESG
jgi:3-methyladenine DNA glycosylase AlkD